MCTYHPGEGNFVGPKRSMWLLVTFQIDRIGGMENEFLSFYYPTLVAFYWHYLARRGRSDT